MNAIEVENISKRYGQFFAVDNLSFQVPEASVYGLLGPNGAGKTTTIRMIMNVLIPDKGRIRVLGEKMSEAMKTRIGYLPEERGLYPKMKVGELLVFLANLKDFRGPQAKEAIDSWLDRFDLLEWKEKKVEELSRGMQQKVQFIATVIHKPELIILDEPFSGLDPVNTKLLKDIMLEMRDQGVTIIFSTHRMEQVEMICDNICLINKAQSVLKGNLDQIKREYGKNMVILEYEGDSRQVKQYPGTETIDDYGKYMEIKLKDQADPQELLASLAGKIRVDRFEIKEPTLNAIFIEKVGEKNE
ncbi:MAG: ATP-binding cassette domain-containing protein [Candidatus Aminicenantes bacterium]|nr:ATP-binding cassette domain-containing protein [Candidatus Aminicenantes bacterium]